MKKFKAKIIKAWDVNEGGAYFPVKPIVGYFIDVEVHGPSHFRWSVKNVCTRIPVDCIEIIDDELQSVDNKPHNVLRLEAWLTDRDKSIARLEETIKKLVAADLHKRDALEKIVAFGKSNPGCGVSCSRLAADALKEEAE